MSCKLFLNAAAEFGSLPDSNDESEFFNINFDEDEKGIYSIESRVVGPLVSLRPSHLQYIDDAISKFILKCCLGSNFNTQ